MKPQILTGDLQLNINFFYFLCNNKKMYNLLILLFVIFLSSCTEQGKKIPVSGAKVFSSSESIKQDDALNEIDKVTIEDQEELNTEERNALSQKLFQVGDRVFFDYDESKFKDEGVETLKRQAKFLIGNKDITITIEGHCDERGTREYNLALGERRAYSAKNFLVSLGVEEDRISVISYGKEKPQVTGKDEQSWAQSRTAITVINPD